MVAKAFPLPGPVKKTFVPIGNLVAVQVHLKEQTDEGLQLPDGSHDARQFLTATVVACGPLCKFVKEGDVVLAIGSVPGARGKHGDSGTLMVVEENNLLAVSLLKGRGASDEERWSKEAVAEAAKAAGG